MQSIYFLFLDLSQSLKLLHHALEIGLFSWIICVLTVLIIFIFFPAILLYKFLVCFYIVYFTFAFFDFLLFTERLEVTMKESQLCR